MELLLDVKLAINWMADLTDTEDIAFSLKELDQHLKQAQRFRQKLLDSSQRLAERQQHGKADFQRMVTRMDIMRVAAKKKMGKRLATNLWNRLVGYRHGERAVPIGLLARPTARQLLDDYRLTEDKFTLLVAVLKQYGTEIGAAKGWRMPVART